MLFCHLRPSCPQSLKFAPFHNTTGLGEYWVNSPHPPAVPDASWTEVEGFPYAGTYVGAEAIIAGVFHSLRTELIGYKAEVHTFLEDGDKVAAFGTYSGTYKATGKSTRAEFAHHYVLKDGKIQSMKQYVDTLIVSKALVRST
jgi:ketosteroid isomerase-like protein